MSSTLHKPFVKAAFLLAAALVAPWLPAPGPPMSRLVRWRGSPPWLNSSNPSMPVAILGRSLEVALFFLYTIAFQYRWQQCTSLDLVGQPWIAFWWKV